METTDIRRAWADEKQAKVAAAPRACHGRSRGKRKRDCAGGSASLERKGKLRTVVATAIARELSAFIWAINGEVMRKTQTGGELATRKSQQR